MNITINIPDNIINSITYCIDNKLSSALIQISDNDTVNSIIEKITVNNIQHFITIVEKVKDEEMLKIVKENPTIKNQVDSVISENKIGAAELPPKGI